MGRRSKAWLQKAAEGYFAQSDGTRERVPQKGGGFLERQTPYTLYGFCLALDMTPRQALQMARQPEKETGEAALVQRGIIRIAAYLQEHALLGELNATVAQGAIKELGLLEEGEEQQPQALQVVLDAAGEVWSR